jgi:hypothetical protein
MTATTRRAGWYAALALAAALLVGGIAGYELGSRPRPMRLKQAALLGISRITLLDSLHLSAAQRARVDSILDASEARADSSIRGMMATVRGLTQETKAQVRATLDPAQRVKFDSLLAHSVPSLPRSPLPPRDTGR